MKRTAIFVVSFMFIASYATAQEYRADSSVRGGSREARGFPRTELEAKARKPTTQTDSTIRGELTETRGDFGQSSSKTWPSDKGGSIQGSANWNPSDDLLPDGPATRQANSSTPVSVPEHSDLNSSTQLERNISGEYNLDDQNQPSRKNTDSVGGAGSIETGSATSAQSTGDTQLARHVKSTLTREATGTHGITRFDVAPKIQVTSRGGTIILKGSVPSQKDKDLIEIRTREIAGVQRVDNQLIVTSHPERPLRDFSTGRDLEDATDQLRNIDLIQR